MLGLVGAVYMLLCYLSHRENPVPGSAIPPVVVAAVVTAVWVFLPGFLSAGEYWLPLGVRQAGLGAGAGAVVARYLTIRRLSREEPARALEVVGTPLLGVSLVLTSANWLVAIAAGILAASELVRRVARSVRQAPPPSPGPPDSE
jgi:hypothetical protein